MERLTYRSCEGDYGSLYEYETPMMEVYRLRNALGRYEDTGLTPEEIETLKVKAVWNNQY